MNEWLDDFYGNPALRQTMMDAFLPAFTTYVAEAVGGPVAAGFVSSLAEAYVDHHLSSSRIQLQEVLADADEPLKALAERFTEWEQKRPEKVARNELVRAANAANVQQMRERGVTRKVWRTRGSDTCPYCKSLNGKTIEVERAFFEPGDEFSPEGADAPLTFTSSIGHPPVHQGCNCVVEASVETETVESPEGRAEQRAQFRPDDSDPDAQQYWDDMNAVALEMDRLGYPSAWSGRFENVTERGHYSAADDDTIRMNVALQNQSTGQRYHNIVHELTHGVTPGGHGGYRTGIPGGWEEGPTDMFANVFGTRIRTAAFGDLGPIEETALRYGRTNSYSPYREGMERIRALTGLGIEDFYGQLMTTPLLRRPYKVAEWLTAAAGNDPAIRARLLDQMQRISDEFLTPVI